jgi:hypothetical protein
MKTTKRIFLTLLTASMVAASCKKEEPQDPTQPDPTPTGETPSAQELKNYFSDNQNDAIQYFTADSESPITINGNKGTQFNIQANSFETQSGGTVTGSIDIELIEIFDKADMIRLNKPTMGRKFNGDLEPLISGGEFKLTASQNGSELNLKPGYIYNVIVPAPNGTDSDMAAFNGTVTNDTIVWDPADSSFVNGQGNQYDCYFEQLNWINCDYFMNDPSPQTVVEVEIPQGFDNTTCALFISFDGLNSMTSFYNYSNGLYTTAPGYTIPIGMDVHFIAVSFINGNPHVAIAPATIQNNHYEIIPQLTQTTPGQFQTDLNNLP